MRTTTVSLTVGEAGAPNVTVVLDGRVLRPNGRRGPIQFSRGRDQYHRDVVTVVADNLPLPWVLIGGDGRQETEVTTRDRTLISIGAQRPR